MSFAAFGVCEASQAARRDRQSAARRAKAAQLDPQMQLQAWDDTAAVSFDQQLGPS